MESITCRAGFDRQRAEIGVFCCFFPLNRGIRSFYDAGASGAPAGRARIGALVATFLKWLNHYPSHLWIWALAGRLDAYFWLYLALNA